MNKKLIILIVIIVISLFITGCNDGDLNCKHLPEMRDFIGSKNLSDCHDYISDHCNLNITLDACRNCNDTYCKRKFI
jgi:hypothetical protein